jgi:hypothetical protein
MHCVDVSRFRYLEPSAMTNLEQPLGMLRPEALQASGISDPASMDDLGTHPFQRTQVRLGCTHRIERVSRILL